MMATRKQLLAVYANAKREHDTARYATKLADCKYRHELAPAPMDAAIADLQRRIGREDAT